MKSKEFVEKVQRIEIKNGTIFDVIKENKKIGEIGVIKSQIMYLNFDNNNIPTDILVGNYDFIQQIEGE